MTTARPAVPIDLDLRDVPFSRFGSYMALSWLEGERFENAGIAPGLWLRNLHGDGDYEVFHVEAVGPDGAATVTSKPQASSDELRLAAEGGNSARVCFDAEEHLRIRLRGIGLRLTLTRGGFNSAVRLGEGRWRINAASACRDYIAVALGGRLAVDAPWGVAGCRRVVVDLLPGDDGTGEFALHQTRGVEPPPDAYPPYEQVREEAVADLEAFARSYPAVDEELAAPAALATYVNWASVVAPAGLSARPAMLMSKNWMAHVWSWDHCFNALALAAEAPEMAWDQFMLPFDRQTPLGQLPDLLNDVHSQYNFVKPPIHGWAYMAMLSANAFFADPDRLAEVYRKLSAWQDWWLNCRNPSGDGLPLYHHGNDSGWDNGTAFDVGFPVKGPDLATFLILQADALAELAGRLGRPTDAQAHRDQAERIFAALIDRLWSGERFLCPHAESGQVCDESRSIIPAMPILLGDRLAEDVRSALVARIRENLTEWGPATEHPASSLYEADGYWRGPIWAPSTYLLIDGLRRCGQVDLAADIAARFCRLCATRGFAENYNALTGAALRDRAYTWSASVFLILAGQARSPEAD